MKISIIISSLAITFSLVCLVLFLNNSKRIDQNQGLIKILQTDSIYTKKDSLIKVIEKLEFEKASYTGLMDSYSTLIIGYVTLLFALFGIVGLTISNRLAKEIKEDYQSEKDKYKKQYRTYRIQQETKYQAHKHEFIEFNKELKDIKASGHFALGELFSTNLGLIKFQPTTKAITLSIYSASNFANCQFLDPEMQLNDVIKRNLGFVIKLTDSVFKSEDSIRSKIIGEYKFAEKDISVLTDMLKITSGEINDLVIEAKALMLKTFRPTSV